MTLQTITIDGDLHVSGNIEAFNKNGRPVHYWVNGDIRHNTNERPANGEFIEGDLIIQGDITQACAGTQGGAS